jgi:hypothetical protein
MAAPRLSPGYVHAIHPVHGEPVVYTPGQELPEWLRAEIDAGAALVPDDIEGSFTVAQDKRRQPRGRP